MTLKYFNVKNGLTTGNIILNAGNSNISASTFIGNINVTSSANLGSIANVKITGGAANYVISTDGAGNLTWVAQSGGGGGGGGAYNPVLDTFTGTGSQTAFTLSVTPATIYNTLVNIDGVSQLHDAYSLVGSTVTFDSAPSNGAIIEVLILATTAVGGTPGGSNTQVQFNNDGNFGGSSGLTFDSTTTTLTANNVVVSSDANLGSVSNVTITGGTSGQYLQTDGAGNLSWSTVVTGSTSNISNGNSNVDIPSANGNVTVSSAGNANVVVVTGTGVNVAGTLNATGNANVGNIGATNGVFTNVSGNGSALSSITGANVTGQVANALVAGTVYTNAQPNITSVGTLTDLNVSGNAIFGGNLTVDGNLIYVNVTDLSVEDPIIQLQTGPNAAAPTSNSGKDIGTALNYYDTAAKIAFMGWDVSNAEFGFGNTVNISSEVVTFTSYGNVRAGYFIGNGSQLTGIASAAYANYISNGTSNVNILTADGNVTISVNGTANVVTVTNTGANVAGTLNITGNANVGNIGATNGVFTNVSGNGSALSSITGANVTGQVANALIAGTVYTNAQPNITSVGTLSSLSVTGNISSGNANLGNLATANFFSGNGSLLTSVAGANVTGTVSSATTAGTVTTAAQPNITSVGTLTSLGVTGNISAGNANLGNLATSNYFSGNGSLLTSLTGGNVTGQVANALIAGTVYTAAQPNITSLGTLTGLTSNGTIDFTNASNVSLGAVGNIKITGGTANYVLSTDGAGNLSWVAQTGGGSSSSISNGTSNVNIASANGNITMSVNGTSNIAVVSSSSFLIDTSANVTGNLIAGNISTTLIAGNITTAVQPNITTVGTLSNLSVSGNTTTSNLVVSTRSVLGSITGVSITGGSNGYIMTTDGTGNLSWSPLGALVTVDAFSGNGVQTTFTLSTTPATEDYTLINVNGAVQLKNSYSVSGANVVLTEAPPVGSYIEVTTFSQKPTVSSYVNRKYTGNGSANTYTVTSGCSENDVLVFLNGICQMPVDDYTISGSNLVFGFNVSNGVSIQIRELPR